ncbi:hypothetical protein AB9P05_14490 [Roseivirga sp. BDSF3-8]|uniref:hypothetical protein n=1 Tax=Roseivirga sp. BDSF3-8 TaxID=3241598 RepID=UPI003531A1DF
MKRFIYQFLLVAGTLFALPNLTFATGNEVERDTVTIDFGNDTRIMILVQDKEALQDLEDYDLNAMIVDLNDSVQVVDEKNVLIITDETGEKYLKDKVRFHADISIFEGDKDKNAQRDAQGEKKYPFVGGTTFDIDIGTNNWLQDGDFPDDSNEQYSVKPWGSWYVGINSNTTAHFGKHFSLDMLLGVSWYNFKFQDELTRIEKVGDEIVFGVDPRDINPVKSKLTAFYVNAGAVPMVKLGKNGDGFRFGAGPYIGYRLDSYTKSVYKEPGDNDKIKDKNHDNFYINNWRYGIRGQVGFRNIDLFVNYDMNSFFSGDRQPDLNAFSIGFIL